MGFPTGGFIESQDISIGVLKTGEFSVGMDFYVSVQRGIQLFQSEHETLNRPGQEIDSGANSSRAVGLLQSQPLSIQIKLSPIFTVKQGFFSQYLLVEFQRPV